MTYYIYGFKVDSFDAGYFAGFNGDLCATHKDKEYLNGFESGRKAQPK